MKKKANIAFIAFFLAVCLLPGVLLLGGYEGQNRENRPLARMPELIGRDGLNLEFPQGFDDYFQDHFGLREEMVTAFHGITMTLLADTFNGKVIVGRENMLFYQETLADYLNMDQLSDTDILRIGKSLALQQEYCESLGMGFAFAIAPNKNSIYPEYMPARYRPLDQPGNRERLYETLSGLGVKTIDFAQLLLAQKEQELLYHYEDTHWNQRGALIAYRAMMELAAAGQPYENYLDITPETVYDDGGDLHNFLLPALEGSLPRPEYGITAEYAYDQGARPNQDAVFGTTSDTNGASLYLFRDSFGNALQPFLSGNLGRAVFDSNFPYSYLGVLEEQPDWVMIELVERNIKNLLLCAPLMPALEISSPEGLAEAGDMPLRAAARKQSGYFRLYGCYDGAWQGEDLTVCLSNGAEEHWYQAFPILEENAAPLAEGFASPQGFSLTLPEELAGEWTLTLYAGAQASEPVNVMLGK